MEKANESKSGVTGIPTGFNIGGKENMKIVLSSSFKWSQPLTVKARDWVDAARGGYWILTMSDGSTPICLFERLLSREDRSLLANAIRAIVLDVPEQESPTAVQLAVAGNNAHSAYFCGIRLAQLPQPLKGDGCPY